MISIIMNCYNGEKFLQKALTSILLQTFSNWELIFWDNLSNDNSKVIFKSFSDKRFKYFLSDKHDLLYAARNKAVKNSSGSYLAFLDVDDYWHPEKLEKQIIHFKNREIGAVYSNFFFLNEYNGKIKKNYISKLPEGNLTESLLKNYQIGLLTLIVRKDVYLSLKFNKYYHIIGDFDFCLRLSWKWKFGVCQECLATYRWHGKNESATNILLQSDELENWKIKYDYKLTKKNIFDLNQKIYRINFNHFLSKSKLKCLKLILKMKISNMFKCLLIIMISSFNSIFKKL